MTSYNRSYDYYQWYMHEIIIVALDLDSSINVTIDIATNNRTTTIVISSDRNLCMIMSIIIHTQK